MAAWTGVSSQFGGAGNYATCICAAPEINVFVAGGNNNSGAVPHAIATSDDGALTWVGRVSPFDGTSGYAVAISWAPSLGTSGRLVAIGSNDLGTVTVITSDDGGATWTGHGAPFAPFANALWWDEAEAVFLAADSSNNIWESTDGIAWTGPTAVGIPVTTIIRVPELGLWILGGSEHETTNVLTSPDRVVWTPRPNPGVDRYPTSFAWDPDTPLLIAGLNGVDFGGGPGGPEMMMSSPDAITWTLVSTPFDTGGVDYGGSCAAVLFAAGKFFGGGYGPSGVTIIESADAATWTSDTAPFDSGGEPLDMAYLPSFPVAVAVGFTTAPDFYAIATTNPVPPARAIRFGFSYPWRFIVTNLQTETLTFLDHLALDRAVTVTRAASRVQTLRVPSDSPEVNIPTPDLDPFVSEGTRLIYAFRREGRRFDGDVPWRIRAAGVVLTVSDDADPDKATSTVDAYDPWQYLYRRPVLLADGSYPDVNGRSYPAGTSADEIIIEQFELALANGSGIFTDFGQTGFWQGTIEPCEPLPDGGDGLAVKFDRGASLGEMLDTLEATGTCDPVFDPVYDPVNRPGILCDFSIYQQAGSFKPNAVFGWDRWPRSVVQLSRQLSGNERANRIRFFAGQAGPPVPEEDDAAAIAKFGDYYASQNLVGTPSLAAVHKIAQRQLALRAQGLVTYTLTPAAERSAVLFLEYREADTVPLYTSKRFRQQIPGDLLRIESIPIVIGDDQLERVSRMLVSFVPETGS